MEKPIIEITDNHTGKMVNMKSISTSVLLNPFCQAQQKIKNSICSHCYAETMAKMYTALENKLARNTEILTKSVLPEDCLPCTEDVKIFRFEAFGDLNNDIQLTNYLNIVRKNPETRFTLWTKRYKLVRDYFTEHEVPDNFTLILSSMSLNKKISLDFMKELGKFKKGQLKSFTVYSYDYIKEHMSYKDINCGSRYCYGCRLCYDLNEIEEISEILKSDQERAMAFFNTTDDDLIAKCLDLLDGIDLELLEQV